MIANLLRNIAAATPFRPWVPVLLLVLAAVAWLLGLVVPVLDVDSAQYAHMSRQMLDEGGWLQVREWDRDYLDKPPLLFWTAALSYAVFGVSAWAFKLPTLLFGIVGLVSVFGLARRLYDAQTGLLAVLVLACTQGFMLLLLDVKTDGLLMANVALACWMLIAYAQDGRTWQFLLAFTAIALGMMAKGPMGLIAPAVAVGTHWLLRREWRHVFRLEWLTGILWVLLLLLPMLWGLYAQFGWEGPRFFFWTQSFGRITGENVWKDDSGHFYLLHIWLWAFLPMAVVVYREVGLRLWQCAKQRLRLTPAQDGVTLGGFVLLFVALSLSQYKLPHYLFVVFPFGAILAARGLLRLAGDLHTWAYRLFLGLMALQILALVAVLAFMLGIAFPAPLWLLVCTGGLVLFAIWQMLRPVMGGAPLFRLVVPVLLLVVGSNIVLNGYLYPKLLTYQSGKEAGEELARREVPDARIVQYRLGVHSFTFYAGHWGKILNGHDASADLNHLYDHWQEQGWLWVYTTEEGYRSLLQRFQPSKVIPYVHYSIQLLSPDFLLPSTRARTLSLRYLVYLPGSTDHLAALPAGAPILPLPLR